jgi:hypothetical protein
MLNSGLSAIAVSTISLSAGNITLLINLFASRTIVTHGQINTGWELKIPTSYLLIHAVLEVSWAMVRNVKNCIGMHCVVARSPAQASLYML